MGPVNAPGSFALRGVLACALLAAAAGAQGPGPSWPEHALREIDGLAAPTALAFGPRGELWVCETGADRVARLDAAGNVAQRLGGAGELRLPSGLALHPDGRLFVADTGNHRIVVYGPDGARAAVLGGPGAGAGRFHEPLGLALDAAGRLLAVADRGNRRVQVLDLEGGEVSLVGGDGSGIELLGPAACAFAPDGSLVVADRDAHRVRVFDAAGAPLLSFGDWGAHPGLLARPAALALFGERIFVGERENHRVQVFDLAGKRLGGFGVHALRPGEGQGKLHYPSGLALASDGALLALAEPLDGRVQIFSVERTLPPDELPPMPGVPQPPAHYGPELAADGPLLVIAEPESRSVLVFDDTAEAPRLIARVGRSGTRPGQFLLPQGLALDATRGRLAVADPVLRRVSLFDLRGHPQTEVRFDPLFWRFVKSLDLVALFHADGATLGLVAPPEPGALLLDAAGQLFVADRRNDLVLVLGPDLAPRRTIGAGHLRGPAGLALSPDGERLLVAEDVGARVQAFELADGRQRVLAAGPPLAQPHGLALDGEGRLWVTDAGADRLHVFDPDGRLSASHGGRGLGRGRLAQPMGLARDGRGHWVVLEHANHRGQRFDARGGYAGVFGSRLYTRPARLGEEIDGDGERDRNGGGRR